MTNDSAVLTRRLRVLCRSSGEDGDYDSFDADISANGRRSPAGDLPPTVTDWFTDDDGATHEDQINRLAEGEITRGCNPLANDMFGPDDPVTHGQIAAMLRRGFLDDQT